MAALTLFVKTDNTARTTTSATAVEQANYTISWSDLTGAGFAASDNVLIQVAVKGWHSSANGEVYFSVGFGTTYAGRTDEADSASRAEPVGTTNGDQYLWIDQRTLTVNQNIYFSVMQAGAGTASYNEFDCKVFKLGGLTGDDFAYAEQTHSGDAPSAFNTAGASVTIPRTGDWWIIAGSRWLVDGTAEIMHLAIHDGSADISEVRSECEDAADERVIGTMAYKAGLASGTTVRTRFMRSAGTTFPDCVTTKIFALRLDAFEDHAGQHSTNTITHSVVDTYQEFAGFPTFNLSTTGPMMVIGWPIHTLTEATKAPYGRIQIASSDWPAANANRVAVRDNGAAAKLAPFLSGYVSSRSSGTLDIDLDIAEDGDISPTYTCTEQVAVAFSLELAAIVPFISSIDADNDTVDTRTGVVIAGGNFGASETGSAKVEVSNNASYGAGTIVEIDATAWSATSVTVTLLRESDSAALAGLFTLPLSPAYLWITDSAGARNVAGFQFALRAPGPTPVAALNTNASLNVDTTYGIRVRVENSGGIGATDFRWSFNHNSAGYVPLTTTSTGLKAVAASAFANNDDVPEVLGGAGSYAANNDAASEDGTTTLAASFPASGAIEFVQAIRLDSTQVSDGQTGLIRLEQGDGTDLDAYTNTFTYTVVEVAAAQSLIFLPLSASMRTMLVH